MAPAAAFSRKRAWMGWPLRNFAHYGELSLRNFARTVPSLFCAKMRSKVENKATAIYGYARVRSPARPDLDIGFLLTS
jgi:hypothetical protein